MLAYKVQLDKDAEVPVLNIGKRPSRWSVWLHMNECNSATEQIEDALQSPAEVVEAVTLQLLHSLRNMGRERAMRNLEKLREKGSLPEGRVC